MGGDVYVDRMSSNRPALPIDDPINDTGILRFRFRTGRTSKKIKFLRTMALHVTAVVMETRNFLSLSLFSPSFV